MLLFKWPLGLISKFNPRSEWGIWSSFGNSGKWGVPGRPWVWRNQKIWHSKKDCESKNKSS